MLDDTNKYRLFFDYINDAAYIHEIDRLNNYGKFLEVNQKMVEQLGYSKEELLKMYPHDLVAPESHDKIKRSEIQLLRNKHQYLEIEHISKEGKRIPVEVSLHLFEVDDKKLVFGTVRDIWEQKKYIRKLKKAKEKAEESDRLKSAFLSNMSHEIRTPMNGLVGFSELIVQDGLSRDQKLHYNKLIKKSAEHLLSIVNDILDISRIETGQMVLVKEECSLNEIIDKVYQHLVYLLKARQSAPDVHCYKYFDNGNDFIISDRSRLIQVLSNLVDNAAKFTVNGGIQMGYIVNAKQDLEFFVKDSGIGIPENKLPVIFERFRQVDDSHTREYGGAGLGLPIAKGIVELMGGKMWSDSVLGKGTTISFTIPWNKSVKYGAKKETEGRIQLPDFSKKTIMIVEDNPENLLFLEALAGFYNLSVVKASRGEDAIHFVKQNHQIDLILMDIRLPDINGFEVTKTIKKLISIPIIAQTAYTSSDDQAQCYKAGCDDYISKPIFNEEFEKILVKYLS